MSSLSPYRLSLVLIIATTIPVHETGAVAEDAVKPKQIDQVSFEMIGIEVRTNNTQEAASHGAIPTQWRRLFVEELLARVPDKLDDSIVAVYTNYASDWTGDYTYILGAKVKPGTKPPEGMTSQRVPAGKYMEFLSEPGAPQEVVPNLWKQVWTYLQLPESPKRAYAADYEVYEDMSDPNNVWVKLLLGIKL